MGAPALPSPPLPAPATSALPAPPPVGALAGPSSRWSCSREPPPPSPSAAAPPLLLPAVRRSGALPGGPASWVGPSSRGSRGWNLAGSQSSRSMPAEGWRSRLFEIRNVCVGRSSVQEIQECSARRVTTHVPAPSARPVRTLLHHAQLGWVDARGDKGVPVEGRRHPHLGGQAVRGEFGAGCRGPAWGRRRRCRSSGTQRDEQ